MLRAGNYFTWINARRCLISVFLLIITLISGCKPVPEPLLRIGTNIWPGYESFYLARSLGYYDDNQIRLVELSSASDVIHALRSGNLEGAALTLDEALTVVDNGFDLRVILVLDFSRGGDVLLAKPGIATLEDLHGKRVAIEYTAVGAITLDGAMNVAGLKPDDIEIINCGYDTHFECYADVDAIVTFDPTRTQLLNQGARQLFDSSQIPNRIVDVLVVHESTLDTHPHALKQLIAGYFKAQKYLAQEPQQAAQLMGPRMGLSVSDVLGSFDGLYMPDFEENQQLLSAESGLFQQQTVELVDFMVEKKFLVNTVDVTGIADDRFLSNSAP